MDEQNGFCVASAQNVTQTLNKSLYIIHVNKRNIKMCDGNMINAEYQHLLCVFKDSETNLGKKFDLTVFSFVLILCTL